MQFSYVVLLTGWKVCLMPLTKHRTHKIPVDLQYHDGYPGSRVNFGDKYIEFQSQVLFLFDAKPFPVNQNVKYECFHCALQIFHVFASSAFTMW